MKINDVLGLVYPEEPPSGAVVASVHGEGKWQNGRWGWHDLQYPWPTFTWTQLVDQEKDLKVIALPPSVGSLITYKELNALPIGTVVASATVNERYYFKTGEERWIYVENGIVVVYSPEDMAGFVYQIRYMGARKEGNNV